MDNMGCKEKYIICSIAIVDDTRMAVHWRHKKSRNREKKKEGKERKPFFMELPPPFLFSRCGLASARGSSTEPTWSFAGASKTLWG